MFRTSLPAVLCTLSLLAAGCDRELAPAMDAPPQPVRTEEARLAPFAPRLLLFGTVTAGASTEILAPTDGVIRYADAAPRGLRSGRVVREGEALARITNEAVALELREARLQAESAHSELERHRRAFEAGVESEAEVEPWRVASRLAEERLRAAENESARLTLRSPMAGRLVIDDPVPAGAEVRRGDRLARVVGDGAPRIEAVVATEELESLVVGQPARVRVPDGDEIAAEAVVAEVPPGLGDDGAARVGLDITSSARLPPPGAGVELEVVLAERGLALTVPEESVRFARGGASVFVVGKKQGVGRPVARQRAVRLGGRAEGRVEVLEGLRPGDRVVVSGVGFLEDEQPVEEVLGSDEPRTADGAGPPEEPS